MSFDINEVIDEMKNKEFPLFVSERQMQVAFAFSIEKTHSSQYEIIPELPFNKDRNKHIDLAIFSKDKQERIAFEFKYVVSNEKINIAYCEDFELKKQGAYTLRCADCYRDIARLEEYVNSKEFTKGYFFLITNVKKGIMNKPNKNTSGASFELSDNYTINKGTYSINENCRELSRRKNLNGIEIKNTYKCVYELFSGNFKYLLLEIK